MVYGWIARLGAIWGIRLLGYDSVRVTLALYVTFAVAMAVLRRLAPLLPRDRGKDLTADGRGAKGKPTGAGILFLGLALATVLTVNGGTGLVKVALLRFFGIRVFSGVIFPLHDHLRQSRDWSPAQVTMKFLILQILITLGLVSVFLKLR